MGTRMFDSSITDRLRRLPASAVTAYFYINLDADDDGVCQDVEVALAGTISTQEDIDQLVDKRFLIRHPEEPERVIVTHWLVHNNIAKSRKRKTANEDFLELLELKGNVYQLKDPEMVKPKLEPEPAVSDPEPEPMLINEPKKQPKQPSREAWKHFVEWTDRYPQITKTDADEKAAYKMYAQMLLKDGADYDAILKQFVKEIQAAVKTGEEGLLLTEIVERVRGDTG
ncbi:MAG: hypothetical protein IKH75_14375 [Ruminococcus sp.]|nr:hypothetical protein [Ruminococcus sp.]